MVGPAIEAWRELQALTWSNISGAGKSGSVPVEGTAWSGVEVEFSFVVSPLSSSLNFCLDSWFTFTDFKALKEHQKWNLAGLICEFVLFRHCVNSLLGCWVIAVPAHPTAEEIKLRRKSVPSRQRTLPAAYSLGLLWYWLGGNHSSARFSQLLSARLVTRWLKDAESDSHYHP